MKAILIITFIYLITNCNRLGDEQIVSAENSDTIYFSPKSEWGKLQKDIPLEIRKKIIENIRDNPKDFVAQLYESSKNVKPRIENLITISFNLADSLLYYDYLTSLIKVGGKQIIPLSQQRIIWITEFLNPIDTLFERINKCEFWNQPAEIKVDGSDGRFFCILIKNKNEFHYLLRWSPDVVKESLYPKRLEYMKLCDFFKNLGKIQFYDNFWNWYGQKEQL